MKSNILLVLFGCSLLLSCHSRLEKQLSGIDELLYQYPDSALSELKRIDTLSIHRTKDKAYYALLLSAARDKCYIDVTNDSLITLSADYFANHGSLYNRMRSYYYQGIIKKNSKNYPAAIVYFEKAGQDAARLNDLRYQGLVQRNMGSIFHATNNYTEAKNHLRSAISFFSRNNDSLYVHYAAYALAVNYLNSAEGYLTNSDLDSCLFCLRKILAQTKSKTLIDYSRLLYAKALVIKGDSLQKAISIFTNAPHSQLSIRDYGYCAYAFAKSAQMDSAHKWMDAAYRSAQTRPQESTLNSLLFRVDSLERQYPEALRKVVNAMAVQDSVTRVLLQQSISVTQKDYYQHENTIQNNHLQKQRLVLIAVCLIFLVTLLSFLIIMQNRKEIHNAQLKEQMAQLVITRQVIRKDNRALVGALFMERLKQLFGLSHQYFEAKDDVEKAESLQEFKNVARELENVPAFFDQLENNLNLYCSGIMDKLNKQVPEIKGNNRKIIALFFAGIPDPVVQILMRRNSLGSLRTLRTRFRQTIKKANATDESLFLDMLETEKHSGKG